MKKQVRTDEAPKADHILSQALIVGETIYLSGQVHNGPDGVLIEGDTKAKMTQIMQNINAILEAADAKIDDIVKVVIYVTDMALMPEINEVYPTYFSEPFPVREAVCVAALPLGASIEISVIAQK
jgi:2-iminobutanoate/2-iminopropanoate deaminase